MSAPPDLSEGLCVTEEYDLEMWHPEGKNPDWATPKSVCLGCPVLATCRAWALTDEGHTLLGGAMAGGLTPDERAKLRTGRSRGLKPITHGTEAGARAHRRRLEKPCGACAAAGNVARRARAGRVSA